VQPLHLREGLQDRVPHLADVDVGHKVEDGGREPLEQRRGTAPAARAAEERLGARRRVRSRRGRQGRGGGLAEEPRRLFAARQQRRARVPPGGPGGEPPRGGGGEGSYLVGWFGEERRRIERRGGDVRREEEERRRERERVELGFALSAGPPLTMPDVELRKMHLFPLSNAFMRYARGSSSSALSIRIKRRKYKSKRTLPPRRQIRRASGGGGLQRKR